jgi:NADH-quinone oxidoreductase subunit F
MMETDMDYDSIAKAGSMLGSGAVIVMDDTRCMVRACCACLTFTCMRAAASARRAVKARAGLWRMVQRIENGQGTPTIWSN